MWESYESTHQRSTCSLRKQERVIITASPKPSLFPMRRDRQRSLSPRGRRPDGRSQEHEHERHRDRSRDHQSSTRRDERRGEELDSKRRQRSRDRSRGRSGDDGDKREKSKRCVTMYLSMTSLINPRKAEEG